MADDVITAFSLRGARKLIDDKNIGESVLDAVDGLLGLVIVLSPVVVGPAALPLLALIEPKNELVKITKDAIKAVTRSKASDYLDQAARMAAANCLLTFTAYFDALSQLLPGLMKLTEADKRSIAEAAAVQLQPASGDASLSVSDVAGLAISVPHPAALHDAQAVRRDLYQRMSTGLHVLVSSLGEWERLDGPARDRVNTVLSEQVPALACQVYEAEYLGMAVDFPRFFVWSVLRDQREKDELIKTVGADVRTQFELVASALQTVDLGLGHLAAAIRQLPAPATGPAFQPGFGAVAEALHLAHEDEIGKPIIDDPYEAGDGWSGLEYPTKAGSYVPQAYRLARYTDETTHLEREEEWKSRAVHDDLGPFLMRHLESPYSVETPLLVLGHPGSGKSLLTSVIAARLAYPHYTTVRVELRDVNPDTDLQAQIEAQVRRDTGRDVNWADFAGSLGMSPPVVILDGYDELLQATGKLFADYLDQVRKFQRREAVQRRPVRVIVTSRLTLIDKAIVPLGTTILRLEEFDQERRQAWTEVWNTRNGPYFQRTGIRPFRLPSGNPNITQLAEQPLLLLMLALYDSAGNQLSSRPDIDQTLLYRELLARFIDRERSKDAEFTALPDAEREAEIDQEMERLGVVAVGMFNRQDLKIRPEELNADLRYFEAAAGEAADGKRRMSRADLLLGSFFFIHESRTSLGSAAFEFVHNTFGEFLTADFILRKVIAQADEICLPSGALSPDWFACLVHTPLHTRPNILVMLREWGRHRLSHAPRPAAGLLEALDKIIVAQLGSLLTQPSLPDLAASPGSPYRPLPVLGQAAVYSLNLVLLGCYLKDGSFTLDEADLGAPAGGCRPWDRLTGLWRSWFPLESLGALAALCSAKRYETTRIIVVPGQSGFRAPSTSSLRTAYNVGVALADDLTAATAGIHVAALMNLPQAFYRDLRDRAETAAPALVPVVDSMVPRRFGGALEELPDILDNVPGERLFFAKDLKIPGYVLTNMETADRLMITPRQRARLVVQPSDLRSFVALSRYEAELAVHARGKLEGRWLPELLFYRTETEEVRVYTWRRFLLSPAAAPALRAASRFLSRKHCADIAATVSNAVPRGYIDMCDIDTATALAVLSWRGEAADLCARLLDIIAGECERGAWSVLDIPVQTWGGLADLLVAGDPRISQRRPGFASLTSQAVEQAMSAADERRALMEVAINALRIGAAERREVILEAVIGEIWASPELERGWVLLLMRWAHENDGRDLVHDLFEPGQVYDLESPDMTYREAMDLAWVKEVLGQADNAPAGRPKRRRRLGR